MTSAAAIALNDSLPWLRFSSPGPDGSSVAMREDLRNPDAAPYEQALLVWPMVAYAAIAAVGLLLLARPILQRWLPQKALACQPLLGWVVALAGFMVALTGTRWLGFYVNHARQPGPTFTHLHIVPYLNLGLGVIMLALAAWSLARVRSTYATSRPVRHLALAGLTAAAGLLLAPLLPFAQARSGDYTFLLDEFALAALSAQGTAWELDAASLLGLARKAIWGILLLSTVLLTLIHAARLWNGAQSIATPWLAKLPRVVLVTYAALVAVGVGLLVAFYALIPSDLPGDSKPAFNPFPATAFAIIAVLCWRNRSMTRRREPRPRRHQLQKRSSERS